MRFFKNIFKRKNTPTINKRGRMLAISDIHGCINTFKALLEDVKFTKTDNLFLLGDYIDRGADSKAVVDYILNMIEDGYNVLPLLGNHEDDMLILNKHDKPNLFKGHLKRNIQNNLIDNNFKIEPFYINFFKSLPLFYELKNHFVVHAGFNFSIENTFSDKDSMLWIPDFEYNIKKARNKTIIHGHKPIEFSEIQKAVNLKSKIIGIDNGCVYNDKDTKEFGRLICLDINDYKLYSVLNCDN